MPRNGSGVATLTPGYLAVTGDTIAPSQHNPPLEDIANMITDSLPRTGVAGMLAPLGMGGFRITNVGAPVAGTDAARLSDVELGAVPIGSGMDYFGTTAPTNWLFSYGQAVSRTTYATLFARLGTTFGAGNGTTTFNLPDKRGRNSTGKDDMGGAAANRVTTAGSGVNGLLLGASGGAQSVALTVAQMPSHAHGGLVAANGSHTHLYSIPAAGVSMNAGGTPIRANTTLEGGFSTVAAGDHQHTIFAEGGGGAHNNMSPTLVCNYIIRVL